MNRIDQYNGTFLNHLEGMYRAKDRSLAVELAEAIGLQVKELCFTATSRPLLSGHLNPEDPDPTNNIIFLYEMPELLRNVVNLLDKKIEADEELNAAMTTYREAVTRMPPMMPHFGIRFRTGSELGIVVDRLKNNLSPALAERVSVFEVPAYEPIKGLPDIRQVFVRTDVLTIGAAGFEQAIELQALRGSQ